MTAILNFFESISTGQKFAWILAVLTCCWILEKAVPLFRLSYRKWKHARVNLTFLCFTAVINIAFTALIVGMGGWTSSNQFGLLHLIDVPVWVGLLISIATFDLFSQYIAHYLLHKVAFLFKFHRVHHSDTKVDATTGTRHHPCDYVVRELMSVAVFVLLGCPFSYYVIYRLTTIFFSYTTHANISVPRWLDSTLGLVFVTPNIHKFHHHHEMPWTDMNYGNIFSIWDRLFGTLVVDDPGKVTYGLDVMPDEEDENVMFQLKSPFNSRIKSLGEHEP
ncbi:MAG: sterol desaturase family protein [Planctomycetota bacterium]